LLPPNFIGMLSKRLTLAHGSFAAAGYFVTRKSPTSARLVHCRGK
jgi:hypothetical protein